jgi:hypothetical protein
VLVIGALALLLAAVLNADGLFELANRQPVGWKRDVARAAVTPFCVTGRLTHLKDIREALRDAADKRTQSCDGSDQGSDAFDQVPTTTTSPEEALQPPVTLREPTRSQPLRVWLGGDSMTIELAQSVEEAVTARSDVELTTHPEVSSGLTRPDYFDWPAYFADDVLPDNPDVVVVMFGANDSQGMEIDDEAFPPSSAEWRAEYRRRVGILMDQLRGDGRLVIWVGQPRMRDEGFDRRMAALDEIYAEEADSRPWVHFLDSRPILSPDGEGYQAADDGTSLRQRDGIHLDRAGAERLAEAIFTKIDERATGESAPG